MQFLPDWSDRSYTADRFEKAFAPMKFSGAGFYLTNTDTVLVLPNPPKEEATHENIWRGREYWDGRDMLWEIHVWNSPLDKLVLNAAAGHLHRPIPTQVDERKAKP